jgi:hypothetical protein
MSIISDIVERLDLHTNQFGQRMDAAAISNGTIFLERELTQVRTKVLEVKYPANKAITFIPLATDIHPAADVYTWKVTNSWGQARIIHGDEEALPMAGADAEEKTGKVVTLGMGYGWTRSEMQKAMWLGAPLADTLAKAARRGHEISIDELLRTGKLASTGQVANGLGGFCNCPLVYKAQTFTNWLSVGTPPTALQIYNDLVNFTTRISTTTNELYEDDTLLIASPLYTKVSSTPMFTNGGETTILQYFLRNSPNIRNVAQWARLTSAGDGTIGTNGYHQMISYQKSNEVLEGVVPVRFEMLGPQLKGFKTSIPCLSKCGGVKWYVPAAANYGFVNNSTT